MDIRIEQLKHYKESGKNPMLYWHYNTSTQMKDVKKGCIGIFICSIIPFPIWISFFRRICTDIDMTLKASMIVFNAINLFHVTLSPLLKYYEAECFFSTS